MVDRMRVCASMLLGTILLAAPPARSDPSADPSAERTAEAAGEALLEAGEAIGTGAERLAETAMPALRRAGEVIASGASHVGAGIDEALRERGIGTLEGMEVVDGTGRRVGEITSVERTRAGTTAMVATGGLDGSRTSVPVERLRLTEDDTLLLVEAAPADVQRDE